MSELGRQPPKHDHTAADNMTPDKNGRPPRAQVATTRRRLTGRSAALVGGLILGIAALSLAAYVVFGPSSGPVARQAKPAAQQVTDATGQSTPPAEAQADQSIISRIFGSEPSPAAAGEQRENWIVNAATATLRLLMAALLAALLAFRPHRYLPALQRNPYVAQTQILLAVVASALMMIVGDNAARAFGIFAAASLVRFRTNIRDPKEITVLLINLAIGLATGVGRWELAITLSVFVLATLWVLEYIESKQVVRSMQLKVKTHSVSETDDVLQSVFGRHKLTAEVREVDREDAEDHIGRIVYHVTVGPGVSTDQLSEEIFSADSRNIDTVEWHQKKSVSYTYR
ncbi:MAG: DUF4956 domain-containing protein [Blastocatellia bacterium]